MRLTLPLNLPAPGRRQTLYVVFDLAESCVFDKQLIGPFLCGLFSLGGVHPSNLPRRSLSRSYGSNLPNSLTKVLPFPLVFSTRLPVSVYGTVTSGSPSRGFSWRHEVGSFVLRRDRDHASALNGATDLPAAPAYTLQPTHPMVGPLILPRHPNVQTTLRWYRNIDLFPIDYAFRPRLRDRLTLSGLTFLRKP